MLVSRGYKIENIRTFNRTVIVNTIRAEGAVSKAKIARLTGISVPTVNRQVEELLREDLICQDHNDFERGRGRPGELFEFNGKSHFVIGIDLAFPNIRGMVADLSGTIHTEMIEPVEKGNGVENYRRLLSLIERLQNETKVERSKIYGIGLGIGGIVDHENGIVLQSAMMGWENFHLAKLLYTETGFTLFLDNDVSLSTIGEHGFGLGQGLSNFACVTLGTRVLCGLVLDGNLFRGSNFNSGRIDNFIPAYEFQPQINHHDLESQGIMEMLVSSPNVLRKGRILLERINPGKAAHLDDPKQVYQAAGQGEPWALEVIETIVPPLALMFSNISSLLDLEMIIISGRMADESQVITPMISEYLKGKTLRVPNIKSSNLGSKATVMGAVMLVYKGILHNW
ncbi:MAG: ROK family transcriptional regulator [Leptolinea sp.]